MAKPGDEAVISGIRYEAVIDVAAMLRAADEGACPGCELKEADRCLDVDYIDCTTENNTPIIWRRKDAKILED